MEIENVGGAISKFVSPITSANFWIASLVTVTESALVKVRPTKSGFNIGLASLAVYCRKLATWAELLKFKAIWIVAAILLCNVVTFFALYAGHCDLWAYIRALACHSRAPSFFLRLKT